MMGGTDCREVSGYLVPLSASLTVYWCSGGFDNKKASRWSTTTTVCMYRGPATLLCANGRMPTAVEKGQSTAFTISYIEWSD
jgi:hypothetical protein